MDTALYIVAIIVGIVALDLILWPVVRNYLRFRGDRVVTCPENDKPAGVQVDALQAALSRGLKLKECSRWPEKEDCGQECLRQIESAPDGCLVRAILGNWYAGKKCAVCGKPFDDINWAEHRPALMSPDQESIEWKDLAPEKVPEALATHLPVCWNCHIASTFRREHPELVTDRPWDRH